LRNSRQDITELVDDASGLFGVRPDQAGYRVQGVEEKGGFDRGGQRGEPGFVEQPLL